MNSVLPQAEGEEQARKMAEAVARRSYGKLIALLTVPHSNIAAAEDALSEAFVMALLDWPRNGCPSNPEAWLLTVARRKVIDLYRRQASQQRIAERVAEQEEWLDAIGALTGEAPRNERLIPDHRLALMFACAHPAIDPQVRAPLILQAVLGLKAETIAAAFLVAPATMSQRLVRAKQKIKQAGIPLRTPDPEELSQRLAAVLDAIYAVFAEGWSDPLRSDATRRDLSEEALFLGTLIVQLLPQAGEALGLLALMLYAEARSAARRDDAGNYVPLEEQDCQRWDATMLATAERLLLRASQLGQAGRYQIEAALQSAHVHRCRSGEANWREILQLYDLLWRFSASPVVALNRTLAIAEVEGVATALQSLDQLAADPRLRDYQPYWAARADLLARHGANQEAYAAYTVAIGLAQDEAVRRFLQRRQAAVGKMS